MIRTRHELGHGGGGGIGQHHEGTARVGDRFHLDPLDWYRRTPTPQHLPVVARAAWSGTRLVIDYKRGDGFVRRRIDPLGLVMKAGAWYLVARIDDALRTYKAARILRVETLDERFEHPVNFDLATHWRESIKRLEADLRRGEARLRVSQRAETRLERLGADIVDAVMAATPDARGWREAVAPIESIADAASLLASFGDEIEVLEPAELRIALADHAQRIAALYAKSAR